jgi:hypothetical protein
MEQHVFCIFNYCRGHHRKDDVSATKSIYNENLGFIEQKCIFENNRDIQTSKCLLIDIIFAQKKINDLFKAPSMGIC